MEFGKGYQIIAPRVTHESNQMVSIAWIDIAGFEFLANLIVLKLGNDVDGILGMKLCSNSTHINLGTPEGTMNRHLNFAFILLI